jgi:hypothetical protein
MFLKSKMRPVRGLTTLPPSMSRLSRQCRMFNTSQPYRPLWPVRPLRPQPIALAARSKARTVFARSHTDFVGSNPT